MKNKVKNLLGRKRKSDNKDDKSPTPNKKTGKGENQNKKNQTGRTPHKDAKLKSNSSFQNNDSKNLFLPKMGNDTKSSRNFATPELAVLNQLIMEYGFEEVLDSLCKPKLDQNSKLDSCLQGLKDSCANEKLPLILVRLMFSYFESKIGDKKGKDTIRSTSAKKLSTVKCLTENGNVKNVAPSKTPSKPPKEKENGETPIPIDDGEIKKGKNYKPAKKTIPMENNKKNSAKNGMKEENKKPGKKITSIGSHYHKDEDGKIFKYQVSNLDGKGNAVFKCYDDKCSGTGLYALESKKFEVIKKHNLKHDEHEYIINFDKDGDIVFKELIETEKNDAQVFKENGERNVKLY